MYVLEKISTLSLNPSRNPYVHLFWDHYVNVDGFSVECHGNQRPFRIDVDDTGHVSPA